MLDLFTYVKTAYEIQNIINKVNDTDDSVDTPIDYDTFSKVINDT